MLDMSKRATYSYAAVQESFKKVKELKTTAKSRAEHSLRMMEVKKVYDFCLEKTHCMLFEYEYSDCQDYIRAFDRRESKKELDILLKRNVLFLQREIREIFILMERGEVNIFEEI